ncbi:hypothetical protein JTE90_009986 [Oedothorax gibbosus]|uniref:Peptidase S1 domain-containing protein n=1 Tax=Oedothorax gibbosus TaxID=931172 RepID=A0AAV6UG03_9ARAC|nr:hypothetical protein JTE90_009986 [Oedothorax gibbosus]
MYGWMMVGCLASMWIGSYCEDAKEPECGVIKAQRALGSRIIGGEDAIYGEFPFLVSIRLGGNMFGQHHCGGAILKKLWILTAAHCVTGFTAKQFTVRVGEFNLTHQDEAEVDYKVEKIILHPELYKPKRYNNDIALLKLKKPVEYGDYSIPTCLPNIDEDFTGMKAVIMGWGFVEENSRYRSTRLQKTGVNVLSRNECQSWFTEAKKKVTFHRGQLCAGHKEGGKDSCQGDSGGPLTVKKMDRYFVVGVVSAGIGCGRPNLPGVYTGVADKLDWIEETIKS